MKTKITYSMITLLILVISGCLAFAQHARDNGEGNPNFHYLDDFNEHLDIWFSGPEQSGSTTGIILEDDEGNLLTYMEHETEIVNPHTGSTGSMKLAVQWDDDIEYEGTPTHLARQVLHPAQADVPERYFQPGQALEVFIYGDGSGNRFRFMVRDGDSPRTLEGSYWVTIDWTGWKRITWDYNDPDNVFGWVNGDGVMDGENFIFDSFQLTKDEDGFASNLLLYFDDLRAVDPFDVVFNIDGADGSEVIAINNLTYEAGETEFSLFPGEYQFFVHKEGHETYIGTFEVDDADLAIDVSLTPGDDPTYTLTFTVMDEEMDLIDDAVITIEGETAAPGDYVFELTPGFYSYVVSKDLYFDTEGFVTIIDGNVFENVILEEIPDVYDNIYLSWDVASTANQTQFRDEYYSVWVSTDYGDEFDPDSFVMIFEETLDPDVPNWQYQHRVVEISDFQQQNIRIAFRHHDSTDKDRVVIDNVKIEGIEADLVEPDIIFHEDFEGGVPEDWDPESGDFPEYDEEWLPEGWDAIDLDDDGFNWYFAIRYEQDLTYKAHMRSQSWDGSEQAPLTPDNWLITPQINMPWVVYHNITFAVVDGEGNEITDAIVTLDGVAYDPGHYEFYLTNGTYEYSVSLEDYETVEGTIIVAGEGMVIDIELLAIDYFDVTFMVNMNQHDDFVPGETDVYITGDFPQWSWAVPGTYDEQKMDPTDNIFIFTRTLQLAAGVYEYKYFDGPSFDDGEWPGGENRTIQVTGDMSVNDIFGILEPVQVIDHESSLLSMFPNPAQNRVTIEHEGVIDEVNIYSLNGQLMLSKKIGSVSADIDLSDLPTGLYIVKVVADHEHYVKKLQLVK